MQANAIAYSLAVDELVLLVKNQSWLLLAYDRAEDSPGQPRGCND